MSDETDATGTLFDRVGALMVRVASLERDVMMLQGALMTWRGTMGSSGDSDPVQIIDETPRREA